MVPFAINSLIALHANEPFICMHKPKSLQKGAELPQINWMKNRQESKSLDNSWLKALWVETGKGKSKQ
jgi:hypothetical protein